MKLLHGKKGGGGNGNAAFINFLTIYSELVSHIKNRQVPPFRPRVSGDAAKPDYLELMASCWDENPQERPKFDDVMKTLKRMNGGK